MSKKNKEKQRNYRLAIARKAAEQGVDLDSWFRPSRLYVGIKLKYNQAPKATTPDNHCPNCNRPPSYRNKIILKVIDGCGKEKSKEVYKCICISDGLFGFVYRSFESKPI